MVLISELSLNRGEGKLFFNISYQMVTHLKKLNRSKNMKKKCAYIKLIDNIY